MYDEHVQPLGGQHSRVASTCEDRHVGGTLVDPPHIDEVGQRTPDVVFAQGPERALERFQEPFPQARKALLTILLDAPMQLFKAEARGFEPAHDASGDEAPLLFGTIEVCLQVGGILGENEEEPNIEPECLLTHACCDPRIEVVLASVCERANAFVTLPEHPLAKHRRQRPRVPAQAVRREVRVVLLAHEERVDLNGGAFS
mmetsp:Transcript_111018/g.287063  ORF Transcript_111018/g.287063 Transcript_111018/m.287063 type:complete len:201 (-) Transcript_111018:65-667(-)